jgi:hypothetical protein
MNFSSDLRIILRAMTEFIFYSVAVVVSISILLFDVVVLKNGVNEYSVTEVVQEFSLFVICFIFLRLAFNDSYQRNAHLLIAAFFSCMLIRELDSFLDVVFHGFWLYPALLLAFSSLIMTFGRQPKQTLNQLAVFTQQPQYGFMIVGLICILIFSRLFGIGTLWKHLLDGGYARVAKNVAEEGPELFGYMICLISTILYYRRFNKTERTHLVQEK